MIDNNLGLDDGKALAEAVKVNKSVKELLYVVTFFSSIGVKSSSTRLLIWLPRRIRSTKLKVAGGRLLADALQVNTTIVKIWWVAKLNFSLEQTG